MAGKKRRISQSGEDGGSKTAPPLRRSTRNTTRTTTNAPDASDIAAIVEPEDELEERFTVSEDIDDDFLVPRRMLDQDSGRAGSKRGPKDRRSQLAKLEDFILSQGADDSLAYMTDFAARSFYSSHLRTFVQPPVLGATIRFKLLTAKTHSLRFEIQFKDLSTGMIMTARPWKGILAREYAGIGECWVNFYNNWMNSFNTLPPEKLSRTFNSRVLMYARQYLAQTPVVIYPPQLSNTRQRDGPALFINLMRMDPDSGETGQHTVTVKTWRTGCMFKSSFPGLPPYILAKARKFGEKKTEEMDKTPDGQYPWTVSKAFPVDKRSKEEKTLSDDEFLLRWHNREIWARFLSYHLEHAVYTEAQLKSLIKELESEFLVFGDDKRRESSQFQKAFRNQHCNIAIRYSPEFVLFRPTGALRKLLLKEGSTFTSNTIQLKYRGSDLAYAMVLLPQAEKQGEDSNSALMFWRALASGCDQINESMNLGIPPPRPHGFCGACSSRVDDEDLELDFANRPACGKCREASQGSKPVLLQSLLINMRRTLKREIKAKSNSGVSEEDAYQELELLLANLLAPHPSNSWPDGYANGKVRELQYVGHPQVPTLDACYPSTLWTALGGIAHIPENVVLTTTCINRAKYTHLVGQLQLMAEFYRETHKGQLQGEQLTQRMTQLLQGVQELTAIKMKHMYLDAHRKGELSGIERQIRRAEVESGKLCTDDADQWREYATRTHPQSRRARSELNDEEKLDIENSCKQTAQRCGLPYIAAGDGAPWPNPFEKMPEQWDWNAWDTTFSAHRTTMKFHCNRWWQTEDSVANLGCEVTKQMHEYFAHITSGSRDEALTKNDFLGLPVTMNIHNALMLSIGKVEPGKQMRTGFPASSPKLDDYDASLASIRVDSTFSNFLRHDHDAKLDTVHQNTFLEFNTNKFDRNKPAPSGLTTFPKGMSATSLEPVEFTSTFNIVQLDQEAEEALGSIDDEPESDANDRDRLVGNLQDRINELGLQNDASIQAQLSEVLSAADDATFKASVQTLEALLVGQDQGRACLRCTQLQHECSSQRTGPCVQCNDIGVDCYVLCDKHEGDDQWTPTCNDCIVHTTN